jgi:hypothetical protein
VPPPVVAHPAHIRDNNTRVGAALFNMLIFRLLVSRWLRS